ncbi:MAG: hypothetical protein HY314_06415 [Acidobacteria bacterium]|nr:hypothetical protein [Acidobacteriota bacterium]
MTTAEKNVSIHDETFSLVDAHPPNEEENERRSEREERGQATDRQHENAFDQGWLFKPLVINRIGLTLRDESPILTSV